MSSSSILQGESSASKDQSTGSEYFVSHEDGDSDLRRDIHSLGFISWGQKFDPERILLLYDEESLLPNPHFFFFHVEGMAGLIGIGVPYSKVTLVCDHNSQYVVVIEEMVEESWKRLWTSSCERPLKPIVFGRSKNGSVNSRGFSSFDGHIYRKNGLGSLDFIGSIQPRWIGWFQELIQYVHRKHSEEDSDRKEGEFDKKGADSDGKVRDSDCSGEESGGTGQDSNGTERDIHAIQKNSHEKNLALVQKVNPCREEGSMIVYVYFNANSSLYKFDHTTNKLKRTEGASTGDSKSAIQAALIVKFSYNPEKAKLRSPPISGQVSTRLRAQYQIEREKDGHPLGWYHDDFGLSFQYDNVDKSRSFESTPPCFWLSKELLSPLELVPYENIVKDEVVKETKTSESSVRDTENCGCLQFLAALGLTLSLAIKSTQENTTTWRESNQRVTRFHHRCLQQHPTLATCSASTDRKMCFRAHSLIGPIAPDDTLEWRKFKRAGLYSNVDMEMEGDWVPLRKGLETYKFVAEKMLSNYSKHRSANDDAPAESSGSQSACRVDDTVDEVGGRKGALWQKLKRKVVVNHDFSQYFESPGRRDAYTWVSPDL